MGTYSHLWSIAKRNAMAFAVGVTISDRCFTFTSVTGESMYPTFTATSSVWRGDIVSAERRCLEQYKFSHGDVILFKCPSNHEQLFVKRLIGLPGDWIQIPGSLKLTKVPEGHCWVEGDNAARSWDSRAFGPASALHRILMVMGIFGSMVGSCCSLFQCDRPVSLMLHVNLKRPVTSNDTCGKEI